MKLTPTQVIRFAKRMLRIKRVPYIAGMPGIGKSDVAKQIAKDLNLFLIDCRLTQKLPEDLTGLPQLIESTNRSRYVPFDTFPLQDTEVPNGYKGWLLFFDELSSCEDEVLAACYNILLDRKVGEYKLHDKVFVMGAGNLSTHSAIAREFPDTIKTRINAVEMIPNVDDWIKWATDPDTISDTDVVDFIKANPTLLHSTGNADSKDELESYAQPRGWGTVMELMNLEKKIHNKKNQIKQNSLVASASLQAEPELKLSEETQWGLQGAVGPLASRAFIDHFRISQKIPLVTEVARAPNSTMIPVSRISQQTLVENLVKYFEEADHDTRDAIMQYMNRMDSEYHAVFVTNLKTIMGETLTSTALIRDVKTRLGVTDIDSLDDIDKPLF